ncbi:hypothetical protein [Eubacterium callanderi]|uniref:hypothetical protein n=1 Tax=Eubacterium callanderi TaxID=53442 RepID=UPI00241C1B74|nr:hypothetical protein [Eubacterium callanderi]
MTGAEKSEIKDYQALKKRNMVVLALLGIILMMAMLFSLRAGSSDLSMGDIVKAIGGQSTKQNNMVILRVQIDTINILWLSFFNLQNHYKICAFPFFPAHPHGIGYRFLTCNFRLNGRLLSY